MKSLENEQELKEEKIEDNLDQEKKLEEISTTTGSESKKKTFFKPRKLKRLLAKKAKRIFYNYNNITYIDYKNTKLLKRFIDNQGQIISKIFSKLPSKIQRMVAKSIKRARQMKLMPYI